MKLELKFSLLAILIPIVFFNFIDGAQIGNKKSTTEVLKQKFSRLLNNGYQFFYNLSDGQARDEVGSFDNEKKILRVKGSYSFHGDDNKKYMVKYTADENGYEAQQEVMEIAVSTHKPNQEISPAAIAALAG